MDSMIYRKQIKELKEDHLLIQLQLNTDALMDTGNNKETKSNCIFLCLGCSSGDKSFTRYCSFAAARREFLN